MEELLAAIGQLTRTMELLTKGKPEVRMVDIAANYQTKVTEYTSLGGIPERVLKSDMRRWYVKFYINHIDTPNYPLLPGGPWPVPGTPPVSEDVQEYLFRDHPAQVTGEWYAGYTPGATIIIVEGLALRG